MYGLAKIKAKVMHELDEKIVATASGLFGAAVAATGVVWHGMMGQPSIMNMMYPNFWGSMMSYPVSLLGGLLIGAFYGWLFAVVYNWTLKNMK